MGLHTAASPRHLMACAVRTPRLTTGTSEGRPMSTCGGGGCGIGGRMGGGGARDLRLKKEFWAGKKRVLRKKKKLRDSRQKKTATPACSAVELRFPLSSCLGPCPCGGMDRRTGPPPPHPLSPALERACAARGDVHGHRRSKPRRQGVSQSLAVPASPPSLHRQCTGGGGGGLGVAEGGGSGHDPPPPRPQCTAGGHWALRFAAADHRPNGLTFDHRIRNWANDAPKPRSWGRSFRGARGSLRHESGRQSMGRRLLSV